jgi:hypothetical protein
MRGGPNFKRRSDLESTDERLHNDMKQNAEYVCSPSFYPKGNLKTLFVLKLELPPRGVMWPGLSVLSYRAVIEHFAPLANISDSCIRYMYAVDVK